MTYDRNDDKYLESYKTVAEKIARRLCQSGGGFVEEADYLKFFGYRHSSIIFHILQPICDWNVNAHLMLSRVLYWSAQFAKADGWFWHHRTQFTNELGLSRDQQL